MSSDSAHSVKTPFPFLAPPQAMGEMGRLGGYIIRSVIGSGGMGIVFKAEDLSLGRVVALKVLKPEAAAEGENFQRFLLEARAIAGVTSDHIVAVYQVGEYQGTPYFAMPLLHGESLQNFLDTHASRDISFQVMVARDVALGLAAAHANGIIHRDIKPGNIWLESDKPGGLFKRAKLVDFGLARSLRHEVSLTATGVVMGTPNFMAPEQAGKRPLDHRSDLFSLGCVMYKMLSDQMAFEGNSALDILMSIVSTSPESLHLRNPSVPRSLSQLVDELLKKDPLERPQTAQIVADRLDQLLLFLPPPILPQLAHTRTQTPIFRTPPIQEWTVSEKSLESQRDTDHTQELLSPNVPVAKSELPGQSSTPGAMPKTNSMSLPTHRNLPATINSTSTSWRIPERSRRDLLLGLGGIAVAAGLYGVSRFFRTDPAAAVVPTLKDPIPVGVLHSQSGTMSSSETPVLDATLMAIDEINNEGGVLGHEIKPVIVDPASDPTRFATLAQKLIDEHRVTAIFGCWTSASRKAVRPIIERSKSLLFYPVQYEGLEISPRIVYTGPAPNQQLLPAIDFIIDTLKRRRIMLVGSDYVFPRTAHEIIRDRITERQDTGARIVGEIVRPLGKKKWLTALVQLKQSEPDFIINTINGNSAFAFYEQWRQFERTQGLARVPILSVSLTENEFRGISTDDSWGDYLIASYFQSVETPASRVFTQKIRERYGDNRVTSCMMAAAYDGVYFWKKAVERAKGFDTTNVINNLRGISVTGPRGEVTIDSDTLHTYLPVRIAQVQRSGDLSILPGNDTPIKPVPFPPSRSMNDWLLSLEKLYFSYNSNWYAPIANE